MNSKIIALLLICVGGIQGCESRPTADASTGARGVRVDTGFGALASRAGAALNSNLYKGGGTDDTSALQAVLNRAENGNPVHLVIDGPALVSGLNVYGNTTVECTNGGGLYLKDGSSRAIIRNIHRSRTEIQDEHIAVRGCFLNGNRWNQPSGDSYTLGGVVYPSNMDTEGTYITGLQFFGVNDLKIEDMTLWNIRAMGALITNASRVNIKDVIVDYGAAPDDSRFYGNTDGLHFRGPIRFLTVDGVKIRVADDALAFTDDLSVPNEYGPYASRGPITDVTVTNVQLMDTIWGIRLLSSTERIDRINISNVTGIVRGAYAFNISHFMDAKNFGNVGSVSISNVNVDRSMPTPWLDNQIRGAMTVPELNKEFDGGVLPFISINAPVENLTLQNIQTTPTDPRPIVRLGPDARVKMMTADLRIYDPGLQTTPLKLNTGSHIENLNLSIFWKGVSADQGKSPISFSRGSISQLNWINTPPMYVSSRLTNGNILTVVFSQYVKAADFSAGVVITVNGRPVEFSPAARPRGGDFVSYILKGGISPSDTVTWSYDSAVGMIEDCSGIQLLSVSEKRSDITGMQERGR